VQQSLQFNVSSGLAGQPVQVWSSNFNFGSKAIPNPSVPADWLQRSGSYSTASTLEAQGSYQLQPGSVYAFTTSTAAPATPPAIPAPSSFKLPYSDNLGTPGQTAGGGCLDTAARAVACDDEPQYLDAQDGSFEIVSCASPPPGGYSDCTGQTTAGSVTSPPVFWHPGGSGERYPYAIIGDGSWSDYTESVDMLLPKSSDGTPTSGGLIGYYTLRSNAYNPGLFNGYVFDLSTTGAWQLVDNSTTAGYQVVLASGTFAWPPGTSAAGWNKLSLSFTDGPLCAGPEPTIATFRVYITASIDGTQVGSGTTPSAPATGLAESKPGTRPRTPITGRPCSTATCRLPRRDNGSGLVPVTCGGRAIQVRLRLPASQVND
jgi:hypothetical protein